LGAQSPRTAPAGSGAFDLRAVLRNRHALRYVLAYGGHCWELFAFRSWLVALLFFWWKRAGGGEPGGALTAWSSGVALAGVFASIAGAELAARLGRPQLVAVVAAASIAVALAIAGSGIAVFALGAAALVVYAIAILGDSGAITTGVVDAATPELQGATLALHSLVGFIGGALEPIAVGVAIGWFGGVASPAAWAAALTVMCAGSAVAFASVV